MKKQAINFSWPAVLSDFSQDSVKENFSRGKLKVFFKGETDDHRYFSDAFAEEVIKSLPYTPVVSYYDEEKDDFVGHAREQQIFGIVDPCVEPVFEEQEDGKTWCVCEVALYTERPDMVGKLAKRIVGQPHSLELDPSSVKYVINYDEKKHFKNIEFTAGQFVGVSVLGKDQKPAFTGSAFFACDENFEAKMKMLREYCESKEDQSQNGGEDMNLQEFMKLSWGDISNKVDEAICHEYCNDAYTYVVDMFEDCAIVRFYYYVEGSCKLMRVRYSCDDNGNVTLGDVNEVRIAYEDVEVSPESATAEINMEQVVEETTDAVSEVTETNAEIGEDDKSEETFAGVQDNEVVEETTPEVESEVFKEDEEDKEDKEPETSEPEKALDEDKDDEEEDETKCEIQDNASSITEYSVAEDSDPAHVTNVEITPTTETKVSVDDEQNSTIEQETDSSFATLTESERAEFEALKRKEKIALVDSYKGSLSDEDYNTFIETVDNFTNAELELELLKAYKRSMEEAEETIKPMRAFALSSVNNNANKQESTLDTFVRKYKR